MESYSNSKGNDSKTEKGSGNSSPPSKRLDLIVPPTSPIFPPLSDISRFPQMSDNLNTSSASHGDIEKNRAVPTRNYEVVVHSSHSQSDSPVALTPAREAGALTPLRDMDTPELSAMRASELANQSRNYEVVLHDPQSRKVRTRLGYRMSTIASRAHMPFILILFSTCRWCSGTLRGGWRRSAAPLRSRHDTSSAHTARGTTTDHICRSCLHTAASNQLSPRLISFIITWRLQAAAGPAGGFRLQRRR
jgi:hypothetical protein